MSMERILQHYGRPILNDCDDPGPENNGQNWWGVFNEEFLVSDIEGFNCLDEGAGLGGDNQNSITTVQIDIAAFTCVSASMDFRATGNPGCEFPAGPIDDPLGSYNEHDQIVVEYAIDGGPWTAFETNGYVCGDTNLPATSVASGLSGTTLELRVRLGVQADLDSFFIDNILVVEGLYSESVEATACENNPGSGIGTFNLEDLNEEVNGNTGNPVEWYTDMAASNPVTDPQGLETSNTTVYAVVNDGVCPSEPVPVDLTVIAIPVGNSQILEECSDMNGLGIFNLSAAVDAITGSIPENTVEFYSDLGITVLIDTPDAYETTSATVFALITNPEGCVSEPVEINLQLIAAPVANPAALSACDEGMGTGTFDLNSLNETVNGNSGAPVIWYNDEFANDPIGDPAIISSIATTVYATISNNVCESAPVPVELTLFDPVEFTMTVSAAVSCFDAEDGAIESRIHFRHGSISI